MLDVIDDQHARRVREDLSERAGHAAQCAFGPRAQRGRTIAEVAFDQRAWCTKRRRELRDEPALAGSEWAMQRNQRHQREVLLELCQLLLPADERHRTEWGHWIRDLRWSTAHGMAFQPVSYTHLTLP